MIRWLKYWLLGVVAAELQVGAHCGLCGDWMEHELTYRNWPFSVCLKCKLEALVPDDPS